jgi:hypothetical protein
MLLASQHGGHQERGAPAVLVAELAGQRHRHHLAERVDGDGPAAPVDAGVQVAVERGERGGDDRLVHRGHQQRDRDDAEDEPVAAQRRCGGRRRSTLASFDRWSHGFRDYVACQQASKR